MAVDEAPPFAPPRASDLGDVRSSAGASDVQGHGALGCLVTLAVFYAVLGLVSHLVGGRVSGW